MKMKIYMFLIVLFVTLPVSSAFFGSDDMSTVVSSGISGVNGTDGIDGINGSNLTINVTQNPDFSYWWNFSDGTSFLTAILKGSNGSDGSQGIQGVNGTNGTDGINGTNASITSNSNLINVSNGVITDTINNSVQLSSTSQVTGLDTALSGKEPTISTGSANYFWNGSKVFVQLVSSYISDFTSAVQTIITNGGYVTNSTMDKNYNNLSNIPNNFQNRSISKYINTTNLISENIINAAEIRESDPDTNCGDGACGVYMKVRKTETRSILIEIPIDITNIGTILNISIYKVGGTLSGAYKVYVYNTGQFWENNVTWNTRPNDTALIGDYAFDDETGWHVYNIPIEKLTSKYLHFTYIDQNVYNQYSGDEGAQIPYIEYNIYNNNFPNSSLPNYLLISNLNSTMDKNLSNYTFPQNILYGKPAFAWTNGSNNLSSGIILDYQMGYNGTYQKLELKSQQSGSINVTVYNATDNAYICSAAIVSGTSAITTCTPYSFVLDQWIYYKIISVTGIRDVTVSPRAIRAG